MAKANKTALVTGGNRGIGKAIAEGLAKQGFTVLLGSRDVASGKAVAAEIDGDVTAVELDLTDRAALKQQMQTITEERDIDVLVNNAGILKDKDALTVTDAELDESLRVNAIAAFDMIRLVLPGMQARGYGRIVNMSSGFGSFGEGLHGPMPYSVSKATLNAITLSTAHALAGTNVKINAMCPGWVHTDMGGAQAPRTPEEGADTAIWLAMLDDNGPSGKFFRDRKEIQW